MNVNQKLTAAFIIALIATILEPFISYVTCQIDLTEWHQPVAGHVLGYKLIYLVAFFWVYIPAYMFVTYLIHVVINRLQPLTGIKYFYYLFFILGLAHIPYLLFAKGLHEYVFFAATYIVMLGIITWLYYQMIYKPSQKSSRAS